MIGRLSIIAMALGLLLAAGCSSKQMAELQTQCNAGDTTACKQLAAPGPPMSLPLQG